MMPGTKRLKYLQYMSGEVPAAQMTSVDVVQVIAIADTAGITIWLNGGWGIDALLAGVSCSEAAVVHRDLKLAKGAA